MGAEQRGSDRSPRAQTIPRHAVTQEAALAARSAGTIHRYWPGHE